MPTRILAAAALIAVQVVLFVAIVYALSFRILWLYIPLWIASIIAVALIINRKGNPTFKLAWIVFILAAPICGGLIFLLWGNGRTTPKMRRRWMAIRHRSRAKLTQDSRVTEELDQAYNHHARQSRYLYHESGFPVWDDTYATFYPTGEEFFRELVEDLKEAKRYIFIEFFILAEGKLWNRIYKILKQKVDEGVEIRVMFDDFGSMKRQHEDFCDQLAYEGIHVTVCNPIRPVVDLFLNNRNHRKIVVIDGKASYTGGLNVGDEYVNLEQPFGHWCDCGIRLIGRATRNFTTTFCDMWNCVNPDDPMDTASYLVDFGIPTEGFVQPYADGPLDPNNAAEGLYMQMINTAQKYIWITTPYLILDNTMIAQLSLAAKAGVDVRIITPKKWDKWYVHPVTQYYYDQLLEAGVRIYEYTPGFIHAKQFVSDDTVATVGTVNVDYRSFYFHFECGTWLCGNDAVLSVRENIRNLFTVSEEIKLDRWKRRPRSQRFKQALLHIFAPFM